MKINSDDTNIEDLLNGNSFIIPRFQRPYSWEEENVLDFWIDITQNAESNYFIGSMVVFETGKKLLGVVDGQQRLTTIMIFLCAIRDAFNELNEEDLAKGVHKYIETEDRRNKLSYVLQTETSFPFLQEEILKMGKPNLDISKIDHEEKALAKAAQIFESKISAKLNSINGDSTVAKEEKHERKVEWLESVRDTLLDLNVIIIDLENEEDAYLIFETLNTRGKDLALADLLKNLFARMLKSKGDVDEVKIKWNKVLETIYSSDSELEPDTFIVHSWQSRYESVTKAKAYSKLKSKINKNNSKSHLNSFVAEAQHYRSIFEKGYGWDKEQTKRLKSLDAFKLFKLRQPTPASLSLVRAFKNKDIKFSTLVSALKAIENFHFKFTAITSSRSSGGISGMYSSFGRKLFDAKDRTEANAEIRKLKKKLSDRVPIKEEFDAAFRQVIFTNQFTSQKNLVRYILNEIGQECGWPRIADFEDLTIEHLVPQSKISDKWPVELIGQLGNLLLVDEDTNLELGNKSIKEKKKILKAKGYHLPDYFWQADRITADLIKRRTQELSDISYYEVWKN